MNTFSAAFRSDYIQHLQSKQFDVLIIGGGITGAGIALDAALRGLQVALVEKKDFAWGTSSRSTKLIHGGLRYLKQLEVGLVREVGLERAVVHRNARHLVVPERMLLPIVENGSLGKTMSSIGLWVYDWLADVEDSERRVMLSKEATEQAEPLLRTDILRGGGLYYEYRTDDARLTTEAIKSAVAHGAICLNYAEVVGFEYDQDANICGACVQDHFQENKFIIQAKKIVNAAGPWVDNVRKTEGSSLGGKSLHLTKGVHLVVPRERLPLHQSVYFDVPADGRMMFAIPRGAVTYIGTTDTQYEGNTDAPNATFSDVKYILAATNDMFPSLHLKVEDVISSWAGLRPLIHEDGKSPSELSRKDEIFHGKTGLISIAGGKLTGYRKMAERVVDDVIKHLLLANREAYSHLKKCQTAKFALSGGDFKSDKDLDIFIAKRTGAASQIGISPKQIKDWVQRYGTQSDVIIDKAFELKNVFPDPELRLEAAEIWYSVEYEMTTNLCDYLIRRTGKLYFERPTLEAKLPFIATQMATLLGWDESKQYREMAIFQQEYEAVLGFLQTERVPQNG